MNLNYKDKVRLISFNGSLEPEPNTEAHENFWKLIHQTGTIVQDPNQKGLYRTVRGERRVLVKFDIDAKSFGLECHNQIENSLWIRLEDLQKI